jgi:lipopolysaccharide transport system ATP-binding protein
MHVRVRFTAAAALPGLTVGFLMRDRLGNDVFGTNTHHLETRGPAELAPGRYECVFDIERLSLGLGHYSMTIALHAADSHMAGNYDWWDQAVVFQVLRASEPLRIGVANLPVACAAIVPR